MIEIDAELSGRIIEENVGYLNRICCIMSMVTRKVSNFPRMSATKRLESDGQY